MEHDLYDDMESAEWFVTKVRDSKSYAQNVYAALCNMQWQKRDVMPILKDELWSCSWRASGSLVARLRNEGDYMDWYCSGISGSYAYTGELKEGYVEEGFVTEEIAYDLGLLGWQPVSWPADN